MRVPVTASCILVLSVQRRLLVWVDAQLFHCLRHALAVAFALFLELVQGRDRDRLGVDFEVATQSRTAFAAAHAVGAQGEQPAGYPWIDLLGESPHMIRCGNVR